MAAKRRRLTDANVARLTPAAREYMVWDTHFAGLGVRVRPSGHRSFVYCPMDSARARRITLGPAALTSVGEARRQCLAIESQVRPDRTERGAAPTFGEFAAGPGRVCIDRCKPSTQKAVRWMLSARLLPAFGSLPLDRINRAGVTRWFDGYSRTAPGGANYALDLLRRMLNHAVTCGHLDTNPTRGIKRNPCPKLTRFLSRDEVRRLLHKLEDIGRARPSRARQADIIRLLLLTGCRKNEIMTLRWQDIDEGTLNLADSKTSPRKVLLNAPARAILERQPGSESVYVFPSPLDPRRPMSSGLPLWYRVRKEARIEDVRLHDLRHTFASHAVLQGIPLLVVSRLLGHKRSSMTLRYAHVSDRETEAAAERIGVTIAQALGGVVGPARPTDTTRPYPGRRRISTRPEAGGPG